LTKRFVATTAITTLLLLASISIYFIITGRLSLYDYGQVVMAVSIGAGILSALALFAKGNPSPLVRGQEGGIPRRPSWVDNVPPVVLGCIVGIVSGYMMMAASVALGLVPARSQGVPDVLLLKANLPALQEKALSWQHDAYLVEARIYLREDDLWLISTHFKSPSEARQSLSIDLTPEYLIELTPIDWKITVPQEEPIRDGDWVLDSQAALEAFAQDDALRFCLNSSEKHGEWLILERLWVGDDRPLVWTLVFDTCLAADGRQHHIDAVSGKFVHH
jgi:hypothetical protein